MKPKGLTASSKLVSRIEKLVCKVLFAYFDGDTYVLLETQVKSNFSFIRRLEKRGLVFLVKYIKESRNLVLRYLSGKPLNSSVLVGIDSSGFPLWLSGWKDSLTNNENKEVFIRALLTILTSFRGVKLPPELVLDTIEEPWKGTDTISNSEIVKSLFSLNRRWRSSRWQNWKSFHMSTKKGPQGQAVLMSLSELTLLPQELIRDISLLGGRELSIHINANIRSLDVLAGESISSWWNSIWKSKESGRFRKLSYFGDKEGKTRVIAILDYWSQSSLNGLHKSLNRFLKGIPMDCTFDQNSFLTVLPQNESNYHSIDLSAATDRMPITLQKRVLSILFNDQVRADAWSRVLVDYPYYNSDFPEREIFYRCGQPMGAYSSWPAMALTHHIIVQVAALRSGISNFRDYVILGDDLVIKNDSVANAYKALIAELDMPYSVDKTHTSKDMYEFAKRWIFNGNEITGFSIAGLMSTWKSYPLLVNFMRNQDSHGWKLMKERVPPFIHQLRLCFRKNVHYEHSQRLSKLYLVLDKLLDFKQSQECEEGNQLLLFIKENFTLHPSWLDLNPASAIKLAVALAKKELNEKDLYEFQKDMFILNDKLNSYVDARVELMGGAPETKSLRKESLSWVLNNSNPLVHVVNELTDKSIHFLCEVVLVDLAIGPNFDLVVTESLSKYKITKGVFSLRNPASYTLAESAIVKALINTLKSPASLGPFMGSELGEDYKVLLSGISIKKTGVITRYLDFTTGVLFGILCFKYFQLNPSSQAIEFIQETKLATPEHLTNYINEIVSFDTTTLEEETSPVVNTFIWFCLCFGIVCLLISIPESISDTVSEIDLIDLSTKPTSPIDVYFK